jgi:hypothetical protein
VCIVVKLTVCWQAKSAELLERVASLAPNDRQLQAHIEALASKN